MRTPKDQGGLSQPWRTERLTNADYVRMLSYLFAVEIGIYEGVIATEKDGESK